MVLDSAELLLTATLLNRRTVMNSCCFAAPHSPKLPHPLVSAPARQTKKPPYSPELTLTRGVTWDANHGECDES